MNFQSLLSDHEQKAFSQFLGQLAQEERFKSHNLDPAMSLQHPHQQHPHLRQTSHGVLGNGMTSPTGAPAAMQGEWIQQISSNPLLAPGGIIDPHAMSQAFLQNPDLMAQATAISQAMVLAQQQQMQLQLQQQQQHQQHNEQLMQQSQHSYQQSSPQEQYQTYREHHQHYHPGHPEPSVGSNTAHNGGITRHASQVSFQTGISEDFGSSSPPVLLSNGPYSSSSSIQDHAAHHPIYGSEDVSAPATKKTARRKGSSAAYSSNEFSRSASPHRSSRDDHDLQHHGTARRKTSEASSFTMNGRDYDGSQDDGSNEMATATTTTTTCLGPGFDHRNGMNVGYGPGPAAEEGYSSSSSKKQRPSYGENSHMDSHDQENGARSHSPPRNPSANQAQPRSKKPPHELLTDAEKKANHIASEQKRRQNIRIGFDSLVEIVPTLSECHRSEALILQKSVDYIHRLLSQKSALKSRVRDLQVNLGEPTEDYDSASDMEIEPRE
ncbi:hypothetical protein BGX28_002479 [Mortierella sp. GBA30]|nr:hypothetical protein BGX28_002479 [Mortierella sp. GBA30]